MSEKIEPLVTVVLPTHNRGHIIRISLASVLAQTYGNLEVIVVDDASTDDTAEVISEVTDRRLRYVRLGENVGAAATRNKGISLAAGEFVFFQDSDDIWLPEKIALQMKSYHELTARHDGVVGGFCRYVRLCGRNSSIVPADVDLTRFEGLYHDVILNHNIIGTPTLMARTEVLRSLGGFDESLSTDEDWDLAIRLAKDGRLSFTDEILVCSSTSGDGVSKRLRARNILKVVDKHMASYELNRESYAVALAAAASDFLENGNEAEAVSAARKSLAIRPSFKGLVISLWPGSYAVLKGVKDRFAR